MENVANLARHNKGQTLKEILQCFCDINYEIRYEILNTKDYGIAQNRNRIFIIGTLKKNTFIFPKEENIQISIKKAIDDLPKLRSGDIRKYIRYDSTKPSITITGDMRKVFHYSQNRALSARELARIQSFPDDFIFYGNSCVEP